MPDGPDRPWYEAAFGAHYPVLYRHRDEAEAQRCLELLPQLAPLVPADRAAPRTVLDLGCGDGRHLQWLAAAGQPAIGLDLSPQLLALAAARRGLDAPLVRADMRNLPFVGGSFGAVLSLFTAFGYFGAPAANAGPVGEVGRVLTGGGHWFLDYFDGDRILTELGDGHAVVRERELEPLRVRESRRYAAVTRQVVKLVELEPLPGHEPAAAAAGVGPAGLRYTERVAVFTIAELDELAGGAGLVRVAAAGGYNGEALGAGPRWVLVYRKEGGRGR